MKNSSKDLEQAGPFLRWAGGKRWLVPYLLDIVDSLEYVNYHEPFLGGGSVFFGLQPKGGAYLIPPEIDLIETYRQVAENPLEVLHALKKHRNTSSYYYRLRSKDESDFVARAARFIYLNQTSFNGIYRVNLKGEYNVPFGNRKAPNLPGESQIVAISKQLNRANLSVRDFKDALKNVRTKDLVFIDPPYTIAHNNNGFVKYNQKIFYTKTRFDLENSLSRLRSLALTT